MIKLLVVSALLTAGMLYADTTDNEIFIEQSGDNLTLTIDQEGFGNKF